MIKELEFRTRGTCSVGIIVRLDDEIIDDVKFIGGCAGNTLGIAALVKGMPAIEAIKKLKGTRCGNRSTSCPDQLALALEACLAKA